MEFTVSTDRVEQQRAGCVAIGVHEGRRLSPSAAALDAASGGAIGDIVQRDFEGELGTTLLLHDVRKLAAERVLLVGLGAEDEFLETSYRTAVCAATRALRTTGTVEATMALTDLAVNGRDDAWKVEQAILAVMEGLYRFDTLKTTRPGPQPALEKVAFAVDKRSGAIAAAIGRAVAIAEGMAIARDLGNLPGNICTPAYLADQARDLGRRHGFKVEVLERETVEQLGMCAFLAVARGSRQPPKLIVMEYRGGAGDARPIVLVGKGITFDAGGISIKPAAELDEMKFDMCGAASVFGALHAAAMMKLPVNVVGIVPATENMPDGNALKPGDIVKTMSGKTVEVLDTDSEGRLVLCDALTYAERYEPAAVIDVATLTGGIVAALGEVATGVFSTDDELAAEIVAAGERAWDRAWRMPLWNDYQAALKSNFADLPNIGARGGDCAVTAACFLSRFTRSYRWVHLDIAGTASKSGEDKGATGRPVALLAHFLLERAR
jgi:leucyl aminopeptidase